MTNSSWRRRGLALSAFMALSVTVLGCGTSGDASLAPASFGSTTLQSNAAPRAQDGHARWTIMVHMAAENNLESNGWDNINQAEAGLTADDVNVIVLFDGNKQGDSKIYKIKHDPNGLNQDVISPVIDDKGAVIPTSTHEIDSGDPKVLAKFVNWTIKNYPADHYMLDIWDHGSGIFANGSAASRRCSRHDFSSQGFAWDDNGGHMVLKDLNSILGPAVASIGRPFDVLGFDACLMGHVETGYQVKDLVNYLVASEKTEPAAGWDYQAWLAAVSNNATISAADLSSALVDTYGAFYPSGSSVVTQAASDLKALNSQLVPAINAFAQALQAALPSNRSTILDVRGRTESYENYDCVDLYHFAQLVTQEAGLPQALKDSATAVMKAIESTVVRNFHTPDGGTRNGVSNAHGLVIYFPTPDERYDAAYDDPSQIAFAASQGWRNFLHALNSSRLSK